MQRRLATTLATTLAILAVTAALLAIVAPQHHNLRGRRLTSSIPTDPAFRWDGTTSDLAQQFYRRHVAGDIVAPLAYSDNDLPTRLQKRLAKRKLTFAALPPLLQRAVVWDSGFAFSPEPARQFIRMYTTNGVSMANIAVSMTEYLSAACNATTCPDPTGTPAFRSKTCSGSMMLSVAHCASDEVTDGTPHMSMWATGGNDAAIPTMNIERHSWDDQVFGGSFLVFAVHTTSDANEPAWDNCPAPGVYNSIIIPCEPYSADRAIEKNWTDPAPTALVDAWLDDVERDTRRSPVVYIVPIVGGLVILGLVGFGYVRWRRTRQQPSECELQQRPRRTGSARSNRSLPRTLDQALLSPRRSKKDPTGRKGPTNDRQHYRKDPTGMTGNDALAAFRFTTAHAAAARTAVSTSSTASSATPTMLATLLNDAHLRSRRLDFAKLVFDRELATGAFGEVWRCRYNRRVVAVKRLRQQRRRTAEDVQTFIDEIQLTACLSHTNILSLIGVAWNALENLCMVMEYLSRGDLQGFLRSDNDAASEQLSWSDHKLGIATGVARALTYLHMQSPVVIHRDVKARNVLLTESLVPKVIDFGVSRSRDIDSCMTVGVGTPYWTAPEVLDGTTYTESSDMYSFGVLLSELDTGRVPYQDAKTAGGREPLQPFQILKLVMAGTLQPTFTAACPVPVKCIADKCLQRDPVLRPSARDVVAMLEALEGTVDDIVECAEDEDGGHDDDSGNERCAADDVIQNE